MTHILIVSLFGEINNINSRVYKIANAFSEKISIVTPDFSHGERKFKSLTNKISNSLFSVNYIHVPNYKRNLSWKRIYSHLVFSIRLRIYLNSLDEKPDIIYCLMPPSSSAYVCGRYCLKHHIPFVIDVIDLWPDSLIPLMRISRLTRIFLYPWKLLTIRGYKMADYIIGESKKYALEAHKINPNVPWSFAYLGLDLEQTNSLISQSKLKLEKPEDEIWICYGGSLGNSYAFGSIINAIKYIHDRKIKYKMLFIGEGEKRIMIEELASKNKLNITITGRLNYQDFMKYLSVCDIALNSFNKNTKVAHSYKFNDYAAARLFILNNLPGETSEMISKYNVGLNFDENNLPELLYNVCQNWDTYKLNKFNMDKLIKDELDSVTIYKKLVTDILQLVV